MRFLLKALTLLQHVGHNIGLKKNANFLAQNWQK
jgi:hypothetical protein